MLGGAVLGGAGRSARRVTVALVGCRMTVALVMRRVMVAVVVSSVLCTVSTIVWPPAVEVPPEIRGVGMTATGSSARAGLVSPGTSPLGAVPTSAHRARADLAGIADMRVWAPPDSGTSDRGSRADRTVSGLATMSTPVVAPASGWASLSRLMTRVMAVAAQLAEGLESPARWTGARMSHERPSAGVGLSWAAMLLLAAAVTSILSNDRFPEARVRSRRMFVSVLERPG